MKNTISLTLILLITGFFAKAQVPARPLHIRPLRQHTATMRPARARALEHIHAIKVAYITDKLHFTSQESANFWPIYNRYEKDIQNTRKQFLEKYRGTNPANADENTSLQFIDDNIDYRQEVLNITRQYNDEFLKVISPQQLAQLFKSEREFNQLLIQQLKEHRNKNNNPSDGGRTYDEDKF